MHDPTQTQACAWRDRFEALVLARRDRPFAWGTHDCCLWAADCVAATTGVDPAAEYRGTYSTAGGALAALAALGGLEVAGARAGAPIPPLAAAVGDVGLIHHDDRELLAVCAGQVWLAAGTAGLAAVPLEAARLAWRVARG